MAIDPELRKMYEKIGAAKAKLQDVKRRPHSISCASEDMTGYPAACNCDADQANASIEEATKILNEI